MSTTHLSAALASAALPPAALPALATSAAGVREVNSGPTTAAFVHDDKAHVPQAVDAATCAPPTAASGSAR